MKLTYERLCEIDRVCGGYLARTKEKGAETKIGYAIRVKIGKQIKNANDVFQEKIIDILQEKIRDINVEFAMTYKDGDKKGGIIKDEKGEYVYTPENDKLRREQITALLTEHKSTVEEFNKREFDFEPYILPGLSEDLTWEEKECLHGIILNGQEIDNSTHGNKRSMEVVN